MTATGDRAHRLARDRLFHWFGERSEFGFIHSEAVIGDRPEDRRTLPSGCGIPPRIHRSARINSGVTVDAGVERATTIGARTLVMAKAHVAHDVIIGDDCDIATGAILGGYVEVGDGAKIGLGAVVIPYRKVGAGAIVGANATVTRDVPPGAVVSGTPARQHDGINPVPFSQR